MKKFSLACALIGGTLIGTHAAAPSIMGSTAHAVLVAIAPTAGDTARHSLEFLVARGMGQ